VKYKPNLCRIAGVEKGRKRTVTFLNMRLTSALLAEIDDE